MNLRSGMSLSHTSKRFPSQRGVAAVEFALVLTPLLIIAFGAVEYGRAIYHYNTLVKSTRSAVRWASLVPASSSDGYKAIQQQAKCLAVFGNVSCNGNPLAPSLSLSNVKLCDQINASECGSETTYKSVALSGGSEMNLVAVRISGYTYPFIGLPLVTPASTLTFNNIEAVMYQ